MGRVFTDSAHFFAWKDRPTKNPPGWRVLGRIAKSLDLVVIPLLTEVTVEVLYLGLTTATFAGLFIATLSADVFDYALAVDFFLKAAESLIDGLAFTNLDFYRHD